MSKAMALINLINEQEFYSDYRDLAVRIQNWIHDQSRYMISRQEVINAFDDVPEEEAIDRALEILMRNAAIYPATAGMYRINWSRLTSALL